MRTLWLVLLVALLGASAWWVLRPQGEDPDSPLTERGREAGPKAGGPVLEGALDATAGGPRPRGDGVVVGQVLAAGAPSAAQVRLLLLRETHPGRPLPRPRSPGYAREVTFFVPPVAPREVASVAAGADGRFRVTGVSAGLYRVEARAPDGARGLAMLLLAGTPPTAQVTVNLAPPGTAFEGTVRWEDGTPFEGTVVALPSVTAQGLNVSRMGVEGVAATLEQGRFRIEGLGEGTVRVSALDPNATLRVAGPLATLPLREPYELVVRRATREVLVRVLVAGEETPVAGADVVASVLGGGGAPALGVPVSPSLLLTSDGDGRVRARLPPGRAYVSGQAPGFKEGSAQEETGAGEIVLRLVRCGGVRGRVTSATDGTPVGGARVWAVGADRSPSEAWSDAQGRFTLEQVTPGEVRCFVRGGGWVSPELGGLQRDGFDPLAFELQPGSQATLDLRAVKSAVLAGRVVGPEGQGVADVAVQVMSDGDWRRVDPLANAGVSPPPSLTQADGSFRFEDLVPGASVSLEARGGGYAAARSGPHLVPAREGPPLEIRLETGRWLDVTVLVGDGDQPASGALVSAARTITGGRTGYQLRDQEAATDAQGRVRLGPLGSGDIQVRARAPRDRGGYGGNAQAQVTAGADGSLAPLTLRLQATRTLQGRVELPDGTPAAGALVAVAGTGADTITDARGGFRLEVVAGGSSEVTAWLNDAQAERLQASVKAEPGGEGVVLRLARAAERDDFLVVHVSDANGAPVASATVRLVVRNERGSSTTGATVSQGTARIELGGRGGSARRLEGLADGAAFVEVTQARGSDERPLALGAVRHGPLAAGERVVRIVMPSERTLAGRVLGPTGDGLRGVLIRARPAPEASSDPRLDGVQHEIHAQARSDETGAFQLRGLGEGPYTLEVLGPPQLLVPPLEPVTPGTSGLVVRLLAGRGARVRVLDEAGAPLAGCSVGAAPMSGDGRGPRPRQEPTATTGQDGVALLEGLPTEGDLALGITGPPGAAAYLAHSIAPWPVADTEVRLARAYDVAGVVVDGAGQPVEGVTVFRRVGAGGWSGARTDAQGRFRHPDVPAGPVTLRVAVGGDTDWQRDGALETVVQAGAQDVRLSVDPGLTLTVRLKPPEGQAQRYVVAHLMLVRAPGVEAHSGDADLYEHAALDAARPLRFRGLKRDRLYALWVQPQDGPWYVWAPDLRGGSEVEVRWERGGTIRGRLQVPEGAESVNVQAQDELRRSVGGKVAPDGSFTLEGVPPGRYTVSGHARKDGRWWSAQATDVAPGATVELRLTERDKR